MLPAIIAPLLKNGLGLVANAVMAKGQQYVEQKLGVTLKPDMSPEEVANLQVAQMEHEEELLKLKLEENKLDLARYEAGLKDNADARNREIQIATNEKAPLLNKIITPMLALIVIFLTFGLFGVVMFQETPVETSRKDILIYVLGVLSALSAQVASYYFGSSASSQAKNKMLEEAMK